VGDGPRGGRKEDGEMNRTRSAPDVRARIAVLEDDPLLLDILEVLLQEEGYEVTACQEPDGAYALVRDAQPDLLILDLRMNGAETGWVLVERLKRDPTTSRVPVIVCSAAAYSLREREDVLRSYDARVLEKPFDVEELLGLIEDGLNHIPRPRP
jgi:DNA-binding response OmpR family regulator